MNKKDHAKSRKATRPQWWQLYMGLPLICSLFLLEMRLHITGTEHIVLQLGILALIFVFLQAWMSGNRRALMGLDEEQGTWQLKVYELTTADLARARENATQAEKRPILQLPEGELKGVLSTTFGMDKLEDEPTILHPDELFSKRVETQANTKGH